MNRKKKERKPYKLTANFLKVIEEWIIEHGLMEFGGVTVLEYCKEMGIDPKTHYNWMNEVKIYRDTIEKAKELYRKTHTKKLFGSLMESALGGYREDVRENTEFKPNPQNPDKPMIAKKMTYKNKRYQSPNTAAAIFLLTNLDPESFINRQHSDVVVKESVAPQLSQQEAIELLKKLEEDF